MYKFWNDALYPEEIKDLRKYHKVRISQGWREIKENDFRCRYLNPDGDGTVFYIESYNTTVCAIRWDFINRAIRIEKMWDDWSRTTQNHINRFLDLYGISHINKKMWDSCEYGEEIEVTF